MSLSNIFILPILTLISIPLALSAWFTASVAIAALVVRLSIIYIELSYALITSYFTLPTPSHSSLLTFTASEPASPTQPTSPERHRLHWSVRRPISKSSASSLHFPSGSCSPTRPRISRRSSSRTQPVKRSSIRSESRQSRPARIQPSQQQQQQQTCTAASILPFAALRSLISGDEGRDFESVGGWRLPPSSSTTATVVPGAAAAKHGPPSSSASSTSAPSVTDEADDRAWLLINHRLELPSPFLTMNSSGGPFGEHPTTPGGGSLSSPNSREIVSRSAPANPEPGGGHARQRHHKRSMTTSVLAFSSQYFRQLHHGNDRDAGPGVGVGAAESGVSMPVPVPRSNAAQAPTQPLSSSAPSTPSTGLSGPLRMTTTTNASVPTSDMKSQLAPHGQDRLANGGGGDGAAADGNGDGYFSLRRPPSSSTGSPTSTPQTTIAAEDVPATLNGGDLSPERERNRRTRSANQVLVWTGRNLTHYPAGVRYYRRRSLSGSTPNSYSIRTEELLGNMGTRPQSLRREETN